MTTIDPNSAQAALFEKLGISKQSDTQKASKDTLGQSDFLEEYNHQLLFLAGKELELKEEKLKLRIAILHRMIYCRVLQKSIIY